MHLKCITGKRAGKSSGEVLEGLLRVMAMKPINGPMAYESCFYTCG